MKLNTLGAANYNLVCVVFAASMPQPSLAVGIANLIVFIPSLFTIFVGMKADHTKKKANWLIRIGYLQAMLFILIALMTKIPGYLAFSIVCFLNIVSDCLSDYRGGLQLPIMKKNIPAEDLMEAYSFNQLLSMASYQPSKFCPGRFDQCSDFSPVFYLSPDEKKAADT